MDKQELELERARLIKELRKVNLALNKENRPNTDLSPPEDLKLVAGYNYVKGIVSNYYLLSADCSTDLKLEATYDNEILADNKDYKYNEVSLQEAINHDGLVFVTNNGLNDLSYYNKYMIIFPEYQYHLSESGKVHCVSYRSEINQYYTIIRG